jgi:hypothetical protein
MLRKYPRSRHAAALIPLVLALLIACSKDEEQITPPSLDGNVMYGQSDMQWVLDNIAVFRTRTDLISPDREAVRYLRDLRKSIVIKVFMGSWNIASQIYVPELFKALLEAENRRIEVQVIGLDQRLMDRDGLVEKYDISVSPTFVVEYRGLELGRIVEEPAGDPASDIVDILESSLGR